MSKMDIYSFRSILTFKWRIFAGLAIAYNVMLGLSSEEDVNILRGVGFFFPQFSISASLADMSTAYKTNQIIGNDKLNQSTP